MKMRLFAGITLLASLTTTALAQEQAIIVLDGSGSMWGQIDGSPKIAIARDVLGTVLTNVPESKSLGLIAYGHRAARRAIAATSNS